jgi:hypothetical protein
VRFTTSFETTSMQRLPSYLLAMLLIGSCASAPDAKPTAPPEGERSPVTSSKEPDPEPVATRPTVLFSHPKLGPGRCVDGFDCSDTVGFPPAGQRWSCVGGKCVHVKLPSLGGTDAKAETEASHDTAPPADDKPVRKKSKRRRH